MSPNENEEGRREVTERSLLLCLWDHSIGVSACNNITVGCRTLCWDSFLSEDLALGKCVPGAPLLAE